MKYIKMFGLAVVAAAALMAFVGASTASATVLCTATPVSGVCPAGEDYPAKTTIHSVGEGPLTLKAGFGNITCHESTVHGKTENTGGATETVRGPIEALTFGECTGDTVTVLKKGSLEIHYVAPNTGTLTSTGAEVTVISHNAGGVHCIYKTENTHIGTLTSSHDTGGTATLDVDAKLIRVPTSLFCASEATWEGKYTVTEPDYLDIAEK